MSLEITPTTWTIDVYKVSKMVFTVRNNGCWSNSYIGVKSSTHFSCDPKGKFMRPGSTDTFVVEYLPNGSFGDMELGFLDCDGKLVYVPITIKGIDTNFEEAKLQEQNSEFLKCKICRLKYDEDERAPRMLTCGHTLCSKCAESLWKNRNREKINCPFDGTVTTLPNSQSGINNLPKNFSLLEMLESKKAPRAVEPPTYSEQSDTPCAENRQHEATVFCTDCGMDLCEECYAKIHLAKEFQSQSHKKLPLSEKPIQLPRCPIHPHNTVEFMCQTSSCSEPSELFCHTCSLQGHKGHFYENLSETASRNQQELEDLVPQMCRKIEGLEDCIESQEKTISSFEPDNALLLKKRNDIIDQFEEKKQKALASYDAWAALQKNEALDRSERLKYRAQVAYGVKRKMETILTSKVSLYRIEDAAKRAKGFLKETFEYDLALKDFDVSLSGTMNFQCEPKKTK